MLRRAIGGSGLASLAVIFVVAGCGGGGSDGSTPPPTTVIAKTGSNNGDVQTGTVGEVLATPLSVQVTDAGTAAAGATVSWSTPSGGSLAPSSSLTDANGVASSTWTLGTVSGAQTATAALAGASGSPVTFTATAAPGPATSFTDAGGNQQTGNINEPLASPIRAKLQDQFGNGIPGVDVAWAAQGGTVSPSTLATDASGVSQTNVTLGATAGPVTITATTAGFDPVTFTATAQTPPPLPTTANVQVGNVFFKSNRNGTQNPAVDTVAVGGVVTWTWTVTGQHSVQSTGSPSFTSSNIMSTNGSTYVLQFSTAGTYQYDCAVHGTQMTGRIVVR
jgi:plastocyanin